MNTFNLRLDLDKSTVVQVVTLRQGDTDGTTISATVYDHGALADLSGISSAYIEFALPDGEHYYRSTATVSGSVVTALVDEEQAASVPGRACNAYFSLSDGMHEYSTASFVVAILRDAAEGMEVAESYDSRIEDAIQACYDAASSITVVDGSITTAKLAASAVTTAKIDDGAVTTAKIASGAVTTASIADSGVTTAKISDGGVTTAKLGNGSVTTAKIGDGAVTGAKLASSSVTATNLASGSVTTAAVEDGAITNDKLDSSIRLTALTSAEIDAITQ